MEQGASHETGIAKATVERSSAIAEIGPAMGGIDRATQQDDANLEATAAAPHATRSVSRSLPEAVARFDVTARTSADRGEAQRRAAGRQADRGAGRDPVRIGPDARAEARR